MGDIFEQPQLVSPVVIRDSKNREIIWCGTIESLKRCYGSIILGDSSSAGVLKIRDGKVVANPTGGPLIHTDRFELNGENGKFVIRDDAHQDRLEFDANTGQLIIKNKDAIKKLEFSTDGVVVRDHSDIKTVDISAENGSIAVRKTSSDSINTNQINIGSTNNPGTLTVKDGNGVNAVWLDAEHGVNKLKGNVYFMDQNNNIGARIDGQPANLVVGNLNNPGTLTVADKNGLSSIRLDGERAKIGLKDAIILESEVAVVKVGTTNNQGNVCVMDKTNKSGVVIHGQPAELLVGDANNPGRIYLQDNTGWTGTDAAGVVINGQPAMLVIGRQNNPGTLAVKDGNGVNVVSIDGKQGRLAVYNKNGAEAVVLDGTTGDVILSGADCAEEFDISNGELIEEGTVMVINQEGKLEPSKKAYDKRVAGVVSGAAEYKAGIVLDKQPAKLNRLPIALLGKVYCKVDAHYGEVEIGDLLTTSNTIGHAMKVKDHSEALGSIIGKALRSLKDGQGIIPILIALQ